MNHALIIGISCILLSIGAWGFASFVGDACPYCMWQRAILGAMGGAFLLHWKFTGSRSAAVINILICIICAAGILVAWSHLTAHFSSHVMQLAKLLQVYGTCSADQKPLVKLAIEDSMTLNWVLKALPFWSAILFSAVAGFTLLWRPSK